MNKKLILSTFNNNFFKHFILIVALIFLEIFTYYNLFFKREKSVNSYLSIILTIFLGAYLIYQIGILVLNIISKNFKWSIISIIYFVLLIILFSGGIFLYIVRFAAIGDK